jgi:hypothetical protein
MTQENTSPQRQWQESSHASWGWLGSSLHDQGFFQPLEPRRHLSQKTRTYPPVQQLELLLVSVLAGAKAVSHTTFTVRADAAWYRAFGLPGGAEQSVIAETLDATTQADLAA